MNELKVYKERPCKKCGVVFATQRCPTCMRAKNRNRYEENPEKVKAASRKWHKENPEKVKAADRKWHKENLEKVKAAVRKWHKENPEKVKAAARKWQEENPEKAKEADRKRRETLSDGYVSKRIGVPTKELSPEIIELKREQLSMFRLNKELNTTIQQLTKEVK